MYERSIFIITTALLISGCTTVEQVHVNDPNISSIERASLQEIFIAEDLETVDPFEPWSEKFNRKSLGYAVIEKTEDYFNNNYTENCEWSSKVYSEEPLEDLQKLQIVMNRTVDTFCEQLKDNPIVIISDYSYVKEVLEALDRPTDDHGGICGGKGSGGNTGCALYHSSWVSHRITGIDRVAHIAHEMFHNVQDAVNEGIPFWQKPPDHELYIPMWFIEGAAVMYQSAIIDYLSLGDGRYYDYGVSSPMLRPYPDTKINLKSLHGGGNFDVYVVGQFATEYLVANVGVEPLLNVIVRVGEGKTFEEAFEAEMGISLSDFYDKMSRIQLLND